MRTIKLTPALVEKLSSGDYKTLKVLTASTPGGDGGDGASGGGDAGGGGEGAGEGRPGPSSCGGLRVTGLEVDGTVWKLRTNAVEESDGITVVGVMSADSDGAGGGAMASLRELGEVAEKLVVEQHLTDDTKGKIKARRVEHQIQEKSRKSIQLSDPSSSASSSSSSSSSTTASASTSASGRGIVIGPHATVSKAGQHCLGLAHCSRVRNGGASSGKRCSCRRKGGGGGRGGGRGGAGSSRGGGGSRVSAPKRKLGEGLLSQASSPMVSKGGGGAAGSARDNAADKTAGKTAGKTGRVRNRAEAFSNDAAATSRLVVQRSGSGSGGRGGGGGGGGDRLTSDSEGDQSEESDHTTSMGSMGSVGSMGSMGGVGGVGAAPSSSHPQPPPYRWRFGVSRDRVFTVASQGGAGRSLSSSSSSSSSSSLSLSRGMGCVPRFFVLPLSAVDRALLEGLVDGAVEGVPSCGEGGEEDGAGDGVEGEYKGEGEREGGAGNEGGEDDPHDTKRGTAAAAGREGGHHLSRCRMSPHHLSQAFETLQDVYACVRVSLRRATTVFELLGGALATEGGAVGGGSGVPVGAPEQAAPAPHKRPRRRKDRDASTEDSKGAEGSGGGGRGGGGGGYGGGRGGRGGEGDTGGGNTEYVRACARCSHPAPGRHALLGRAGAAHSCGPVGCTVCATQVW